MLQRITTAELELGMFVEKMEGSWFDHPFWRARFLIDDKRKLEKLQASALDAVIIDTRRGKPPAGPTSSAEKAETPTPVSPMGSRVSPGATPLRRRSRNLVSAQSTTPLAMHDEVDNALKVESGAVSRLGKEFARLKLRKAMNVRDVEPVVEDIYCSVQRNPNAFSGLMRCKLSNESVYRHALSVSALMVSLARKLRMTPNEQRRAGLAGLLLDIGVVHLPSASGAALGHPADMPHAVWRQHVGLGITALEKAGSIHPEVLQACLHHHEAFDGSGFPARLAGEDISILGRMAAICDSFDLMLIGGEQQVPLDPAAAIRQLQQDAAKFDGEILRRFIEMVGFYPVGSFVELRNGQLAMVVDVSEAQPTRPVVRTFFSLERGERIEGKTLNLRDCDTDLEIIDSIDIAGFDLPEEAALRELLFFECLKR